MPDNLTPEEAIHKIHELDGLIVQISNIALGVREYLEQEREAYKAFIAKNVKLTADCPPREPAQ